MEQKKTLPFNVTSFTLHILAMAFMLSDHLGATIVSSRGDWMTCVGRLAFPIFAFMTVEGFFHTGSRKKYAKRLLIAAILSEIPFNLMMGASFVYPFHQNVLWCFLLCIGLMQLNEKAKATGRWWIRILTAAGTIVLGTVVGMVTFMDYMHYGVWMVLTFYFVRGNSWLHRLVQLVLFIWINDEVGGIAYLWNIFGREVFFSKQWFAVAALVPIWMYNGKQGYHSKGFQRFCYAFYPVHMLILGLIIKFGHQFLTVFVM